MTIIHGLQAQATQTICSNLKVFHLQIQVDSEDKQIKQNAMQIYIDMPNTANLLLNISELEVFNLSSTVKLK